MLGEGYVEKYFFFQIRISHALRFIFICDLFTDSPSYVARSRPPPPFVSDLNWIQTDFLSGRRWKSQVGPSHNAQVPFNIVLIKKKLTVLSVVKQSDAGESHVQWRVTWVNHPINLTQFFIFPCGLQHEPTEQSGLVVFRIDFVS
jgi:hypothetical protein